MAAGRGTGNKPVKVDLKDMKDVKVQTPLGNDPPGDWGQVSFNITKVYPEQQVTKTMPFHSEGGYWTFFDCQTNNDPPALFTVGVAARGEGKGPMAWGKAVLAVANRDAGDRFLHVIAKGFHTNVPRSRDSSISLEPLSMGTAVLGENLNKSADGGYSGTGGGWTCTKWFLQQDGFDAEVFFNYNLQSLRGEFTEKDTDYRKGLISILAESLRDGPHPERTPENDPNLSLTGPGIEEICCLLPRRAYLSSFSPNGKSVVYEDKSTVFEIDPKQPDKRRELARFDGHIAGLHVLDGDLRLVVCETTPESDEGYSSTDPARIWWVEPGKDKRVLAGPEKHIEAGDPPASPDGRFVAINRWKDRAGRRGSYTTVTFIDRRGGTSTTAEIPDTSLDVVAWRGSGSELRAVLSTDRWRIDTTHPEMIFLADPSTGSLIETNDPSLRGIGNNSVSPDGRHRVEIAGKYNLVVVDLKTNAKHVFNVHEDDIPYVEEHLLDAIDFLEWAGPDYLKFNPGRLALININSMKMSYPIPRKPPGASALYTFSPDFRWVLINKEQDDKAGLYLGRVLPAAGSGAGR
jgi:hypothetical protein